MFYFKKITFYIIIVIESMEEKVMKNIKKSNFELMFLISMFLIVLCHIINHGQTLQHSNGTILLILKLLISITLVHVNSFILLTGYFQYNKHFKFKNF